MARIPKQALKWLGVDRASEVMRCRVATDTSGRKNAVLVSKVEVKWARKTHSSVKAYVAQKGVSYEWAGRKVGGRGSRKTWAYARSLKGCR